MSEKINASKRYDPEEVAQFIEWISADISRRPERHAELTPDDLVMWAGFPAQVRAHRYPFIVLDPDQPILGYLKSGYIGPGFSPAQQILG